MISAYVLVSVEPGRNQEVVSGPSDGGGCEAGPRMLGPARHLCVRGSRGRQDPGGHRSHDNPGPPGDPPDGDAHRHAGVAVDAPRFGYRQGAELGALRHQSADSTMSECDGDCGERTLDVGRGGVALGSLCVPGPPGEGGSPPGGGRCTQCGRFVLGGGHVVPDVVILDDESAETGVRRSLDTLAAADLIVGPYGSDLVREAAQWASERERVLWNHGGSADDVERSPGVVSVASPASRYLAAVLEALAGRVKEGRVLLAVGRGRFGEAAASGEHAAAARLGMSTVGVLPHDEVPDAPDADVLLAAGSFDEDVTLLRRLRTPPAVIGVVAGGMGGFAGALGPRAEGVLAPSQWEEGVHHAVDVGPRQAEVVRALRARVVPKLRTGVGPGHVDYLSAQAYAIVLVALRCVEDAGSLDDEALLLAAQRLRCTTSSGASASTRMAGSATTTC